MKCQHCGKNEANVHLRQSVNGQVSEQMLCSQCAEKLGVGGMFADFGSFGSFGGMSLLEGFPFGGMLGSMLGGSAPKTLPQTTRCKLCGSGFDDIAKRGKVGCAECYELFADRLEPSIERIHNRARHIGKLPGKAAAPASPVGAKPAGTQQAAPAAESVESLRAQLRAAVEKEEYERAAVLRDRIKEMESK